MDDLLNIMYKYQARVEQVLDQWLPCKKTLPGHLHEAMRYSVLNGGKRIRPILVYLTGEALGLKPETLDGSACAVELIHAYSLIHDDLPAMDDDDLRRGQATCHKAFDEATAILAGDALQSLAFQILAQDESMQTAPKIRLQMIQKLAEASGSHGMVGGQAIDLISEGQRISLAELENLHILKTGALIRASVQLGALNSSTHEPSTLKKLDHYAKCIGLAFQVKDDILDVEGDTQTLGKPQGADLKHGKSTYPALVGVKEARQMAEDLHLDALHSLKEFGNEADPLRWISQYIIQRSN